MKRGGNLPPRLSLLEVEVEGGEKLKSKVEVEGGEKSKVKVKLKL